MTGPEIIDHAEPWAATTPESLGEAVAHAAWAAKGQALIVPPPTYAKAVSDLRAQCPDPMARRAFDRTIGRLAADDSGILRPKLPQARRSRRRR